MIKIEFLDGKEPLEIEADTLKEAVEKAIREGEDLRGVDLRGSNLSETDLSGADLHESNLSETDLSWADLQGADLDFSCWPLWCWSLNVKIDKRIFCQLLYHTLRAGQSVDDPEVKRFFEIPEVVNLANKFHRVYECGKIELKGENNGNC